jgi:hypothetical protein
MNLDPEKIKSALLLVNIYLLLLLFHPCQMGKRCGVKILRKYEFSLTTTEKL